MKNEPVPTTLAIEQVVKHRDALQRELTELNKAVNVLIAAGFISDDEVSQALSFIRGRN